MIFFFCLTISICNMVDKKIALTAALALAVLFRIDARRIGAADTDAKNSKWETLYEAFISNLISTYATMDKPVHVNGTKNETIGRLNDFMNTILSEDRRSKFWQLYGALADNILSGVLDIIERRRDDDNSITKDSATQLTDMFERNLSDLEKKKQRNDISNILSITSANQTESQKKADLMSEQMESMKNKIYQLYQSMKGSLRKHGDGQTRLKSENSTSDTFKRNERN